MSLPVELRKDEEIVEMLYYFPFCGIHEAHNPISIFFLFLKELFITKTNRDKAQIKGDKNSNIQNQYYHTMVHGR